MSVTFDKRKKDFIGKKDKSNIGQIDKKIKKLCDKINALGDYFTLSSCSGRIVLLKNIASKKHDIFLFRSHNLTSFKNFKEEISKIKYNSLIIFKQEPCILHVACRGLFKANLLLKKARDCGWKQSGIISIDDNRIVCELKSSENIQFILMEKRKLLVDDNYIKIILREANKKLKRSWKKIKILEEKPI